MERIPVGVEFWSAGQGFTPTPTIRHPSFGIRVIRVIRGPTHPSCIRGLTCHQRTFAASSASSLRSPLCNSTWAAMACSRKRFTT